MYALDLIFGYRAVESAALLSLEYPATWVLHESEASTVLRFLITNLKGNEHGQSRRL